MELNTRLDRDRYTWMSRDLNISDRASLLVEVTAPPLPRRRPPRTKEIGVKWRRARGFLATFGTELLRFRRGRAGRGRRAGRGTRPPGHRR